VVTAVIPFDPENDEQIELLAALWNSASTESMPISAGFVQFNTRSSAGGVQAGRIALDEHDRPAGFVLASAHPDAPPTMNNQVGWIDAIAVAPPFQRQGIGSELLAWAESWVGDQGCSRVMIGGSLRPFVPGVPTELKSDGFFLAHGYEPDWDDGIVWDLARDLADYTPPPDLERIPCAARPAQPGQRQELLRFLESEFPGRWTYECKEFLQNGGRISDYMLLWTEEGVQGACRLTFEDSGRPIERFFPYELTRPWGQLGSIGIAKAARGRGFGLALLDAGLRRLHNNGINGCVIDWTTLLGFYGKVSFTPYRSYRQMNKALAPS
jgi:GNAT superfamily N-acetyltransferase